MTTKAALEAAAQSLLRARRDGTALPPLPANGKPTTLAEGYELQDLLIAAMGEPVIGWKIGATAKPVQVKFGTNEPFTGPFFSSTTYETGADIPSEKLQHHKIECEFAFRLGTALPGRTSPYTRAEVVAACDALIPAIEVVSPRFAAIPFGDAPTAIGDWGVNGAMVFGKAVTANWKEVDLAHHEVKLTIDDALVAEGTGAIVLGNPLDALTWSIEHFRKRGRNVPAGTIISTGTMTGIVDVAVGQPVFADFGRFGMVQMTFV